MQCVILAGGLATRMRPLTEKIPKSLLLVQGDRPFVDYQLQALARQGVTDVVFCIGHHGKLLRDYVADGAQWGLNVRYSDEGQELRGTGGALRLALDHRLLQDTFFVMYGDSFLPIDFAKVWQAFSESKAAALMTVMENFDQWDQSNACFVNGKVTVYDKKISPKPSGMRFIDYGLSVVRASELREKIPSGEKYDLAEFFKQVSQEGRLDGFLVEQRFYEIGSPQGLEEFRQFVSQPN